MGFLSSLADQNKQKNDTTSQTKKVGGVIAGLASGAIETPAQKIKVTASPFSSGKWYKGDTPTLAETYGRIYKISVNDMGLRKKLTDDLAYLQTDPTSRYYNKLKAPSNRSLEKLAAYGIDVSNVNEETIQSWIPFMQEHLQYNGTTNTPSKPNAKKGTKEQWIAYEMYQVWDAEKRTQDLEKNWNDMKKKASFYAQMDRNYSDDEILAKLDINDYTELKNALYNADVKPREYNRGIDYSEDALRAVIWAARQPSFNGNLQDAMAMSALGYGKVWKEDPEISAKLNPKSEKFQPYAVGSTNVDDAAYHFGVLNFTESWIKDNIDLKYNGTDEDKRYFAVAEKSVNNATKADAAQKALYTWINDNLGNISSTTEAKKALDNVLSTGKLYLGSDGKYYTKKGRKREEIDLSILNQMDVSMGKQGSTPSGDLLAMGWGNDYKYDNVLSKIYDNCYANQKKETGLEITGNSVQSWYDKSRLQSDSEYARVQEERWNKEHGEAPAGANVDPRRLTPEQKDKIKTTKDGSEPIPYNPPTQDEIETAKMLDEKVQSSVLALEGFLTPEEEAVIKNAGSVIWDKTKEFFDWAKSSLGLTESMGDDGLKFAIGGFIDTSLKNTYDVAKYETTQAQLEADNEEYAKLELKYGDVKLYQEATSFKPQKEVTVGDYSVYLDFNDKTGRYDVANIYNTNGGGVNYSELQTYANDGLEWAQDIITEANNIAKEESKGALAGKKALDTANGSKETKEEIDQYKKLAGKIAQEQETIDAGAEQYQAQKAEIAESRNRLENMKDAAEMLGLDTKVIEQADAFLNYMTNFYDEPQLPQSDKTIFQTIDSVNEMFGRTVTTAEKSEQIHGLMDEIDKQIDYIQMTQEFLETNGYQVPEKISRNMQLKLEDLQNQKKSFEYSLILTDTKPEEFKKAVAAGKEFEKKHDLGDMHYWSALYNNDLYYTLGRQDRYTEESVAINPDAGIDNKIVTEEEADIYYYLLGKNVLEMGKSLDKALDNIGNDQVTTGEALQKVYGDAIEYQKFMQDDNTGFGVWSTREVLRSTEWGKELVDQGLGTGILANLAATAVSPIESMESIYYLLDRFITGDRFNPNTKFRGVSKFKEATRAATFESIDKVYEKSPVLKTLARLGYEVYANRGDSLMNSVMLGPLFGGAGMLGEFYGALPMGATAAMNAAANAVTNGATTEEAWLIAGVTFLAETATEAITYSNIKEALGTAEKFTKESLKTFAKDWLTKTGIEEMIGESANDIIENAVDMYVSYQKDSKYKGEHAELIAQFRSEGYSAEEAEVKALEEETKGVLHTAFVSYISPGADVLLKAGVATRNSALYYRNLAHFYQANDIADVSALELFRADWKARKAGTTFVNQGTKSSADKVLEGEEDVNEQYNTEAKEGASTADENLPEYAKKAKDDYERGQQKKASGEEASTAAPGTKIETAADIIAIERARSGDENAQTAAMASALTTESRNGNDVKANAASTFMPKVLGQNASTEVQTILAGAEKADLPVRKVKTALKNAALGDGAATALVQSDEFKNATPDMKAQMLIDTIAKDSNDKVVQQNINGRVLQYRKARQIANAAAQGRFDQATADQQAAAKAAENTAKAQSDLVKTELATEDAQRDVETQAEAVKREPTEANKKKFVAAANKRNSTDISRQQAADHLENQKQAQAEAEDKADKSTADAITTVRAETDQTIAQEDQQMAEEDARKAEEDRIAAEQAEKQRVEQEEEDNATTADIEGYIAALEAKGNKLTEEEKQRVRDRFAAVKADQQASAEAQTETSPEAQTDNNSDAYGDMNDRAAQRRRKAIAEIERRFGYRIVPIDTANKSTKPNEKPFYFEGKTDNTNRVIYLDSKTVTNNDIMYRIIGHELTHVAELAGEDNYNALANSIARIFYGADASVQQAVKNLNKNKGVPTSLLEADIVSRKADYDGQLHKKHDYQFIAEEVIADRMGDIINQKDENKRQAMIDQLVAEDPSTARKLLNSLKSFMKKALGMKGAWQSNTQKTVDMLNKTIDMALGNQHGQSTNSKNDGNYQIKWNYEGDFTITFDQKVDPATRKVLENMLFKPVGDEGRAWKGGKRFNGSTKAIEQMLAETGNKMSSFVNRTPYPTRRSADNRNGKSNVPDYDLRESYLSNNLTLRFKNAPSEKVNQALRGIGMVPFKDSYGWGWRFGKGVKLTEQQIRDAIEGAGKTDNTLDRSVDITKTDLFSLRSSDGEEIATELPGGTVALNTERYSLASFTPEEQDRVRQALLNKKDKNGNKEFTQEAVDKYLEDALNIAKVIADNRTRLDFEASDNQTFLKPNTDYYFTLDASTLCAKRLLYQGTFDYVQHALPDEVFTPEDLIDLVNIMNEMGYETPCGICYVESRRRWLDTYAQKFLDELPTDADGFIKTYFKKASSEEKAAIRESFTEEKPSIDDLTTSDGLESLRHSNPYMYRAFVAAMNKKGTANPKLVQLRTEYRGDINKLTDKDIQKVKDIGGLRIQSFSDFETPHLLDMVQAVMDMSARGLTAQAYTKVPNFAWVFGNTGIKINLSLIGKGTGLDENGNLVFDNREGINFDEAMKLREKYGKNVGTILVGINDDHIIAAMGDPRVDYIIPFHKSGWSQEELRKMPTLNNYSDYTNSQNETIIVGERKHKVKEVKDLGMKALDNWVMNEGDQHPGYKVIEQENGKFTVTYEVGYETESFKTHKERTGESLSNFEPVGANHYWEFSESGEWNARKYLQMCAESGRIPKFSQFLVDNGDGTFSLPEGNDKRSTAIREGYWKTLIDFKMYENDSYGRTKEDGSKTTVRGAAQEEVTPNINMAEAYRVMDEHKLGRQMPDKENGAPGAFIPMESNNSVPVAVPAAEAYIDLIKRKREGNKPVNPDDTLEASPSIDVGSLGKSAFGQGPSEEANMNARTAFGATPADATLGNEGNEYVEPAEQQNVMYADDDGRLSLPVKDEKTLEFLNEQERTGNVTTTYRTMKLLNGKLVSPKATYVNGELGEGAKLGEWEMATEDTANLMRKVGENKYLPYFDNDGNPVDDLADAYYMLDEKTKKDNPIGARYNPYMHSSNVMLNDQFKGAYKYSDENSPYGRFVTVECIVPNSEITSGYMAKYAKDPVGWTGWNSGVVANKLKKKGITKRDVFLSRWIKPIRIVPDSEVAQHYKDLIGDTGIEVPANVVNQSLRDELKKIGVPIGKPQAGTVNRFVQTTGERYSLPSDAPYLSDDEANATANDQRILRYSLPGEGEQNAINILNGVDQKTGEPVDFISLILDNKKHGETRKNNKSLPRNQWIGLARDGKVYGRVIFGEPIEITTSSPEYEDAKIKDTDYDIGEGETTLYYPILQREDFRDNPKDAVPKGFYKRYHYNENPSALPDNYDIHQSKTKTDEEVHQQGFDATEAVRYSLAGPNAFGEYGEKVKIAQEMARQGASDDEIYEKTGAVRGYKDNFWLPLDNRDIQISSDGLTKLGRTLLHTSEKVYLEDILDADELLTAYPQLRDIRVRVVNDLGDNVLGQTTGESEILLSPLAFRGPVAVTLRHEIQHIIQNIEGRNAGTSPETWAKIQKVYRNYDDFLGKSIMSIEKRLGFSLFLDDELRFDKQFMSPEEIEIAVQEMSPLERKLLTDEKRLTTEYMEVLAYTPDDLYEDTVGEMEARSASNPQGNQIPSREEYENAIAIEDYVENGYVKQPNWLTKYDYISTMDGYRYSLPSDAPYLSAVDHGDMETAERLLTEEAKSKGLRIFDEQYPTLQSLYDGVKNGELLIHARRLDKQDIEALQYGLDPTWGETMQGTEAAGFLEEYGMDHPELVFASDGTSWSGDERNGIIFVRRDGFQKSNGDGTVTLPDGSVVPYELSPMADYESDVYREEPAGVEPGDWYSNQTADVVAAMPFYAKSGDVVTYDDNGNIIPPSERFNDQTEDVRYSLPSDDVLDQQIRDYLANGGVLGNRNPIGPYEGYRQWGNKGAQQSDELAEAAKDYVRNSPYLKDTNADELARAIEWVRKNRRYEGDDGFWASLDKVTAKNFDYRSKDGQARMVAVMALAVAKGDDGVPAQVQLADAFNRQGTDLGQALQARKLFRLMTPAGRISTLQKMLSRAQEETGNGDLHLSDWIYKAASEASGEGAFNKIRQAAAVEIASQIPANWKDKMRAIRMLSMLGNPRTHIRNIIGNALFVPAVGLKNKMAAIIEAAKLDKGERTKYLGMVLDKDIREFARQDARFMKDDLTGESKYLEGNLVQREMKPFKGFMQALIDFNSNALEAEDWFFLRGHYRRALGGWIQANGYTVEQLKDNPDLLDKGRAYAINEAQKATYRDYNGLADRLNKLSRDPQTFGEKALAFTVDAVLPFKKTPANILKRGIEYSPAGLIRGLKNAMVDVKSGKVTASQAIDRICSGLSGTAVLALGAFLSHSGMVKCGMGDDEDKFEKEQGNQKYSIRLFGSDVTFTVDWAAPMSMPFFVGAAIYDQFSKGGDVDIGSLIDAMTSISEPVFNLSMLDGVNTLFKTSQSEDTDSLTQIGAKILSNYVTSYVPSAVGAITRTVFDDKRRANFVESGQGKGLTGTFRYAQEQVENKLPGLSKTNIPVRDVFGNEESDSFVERFFENFILPGYISNLKNDPILKEMDRLYGANVKDSNAMIPKDPPKKFSANGKEYILTAEQWDLYKTTRGKTAHDMLAELLTSQNYKNATDAEQVQMMKQVWDYADTVGQNAVAPEVAVDPLDGNPLESIMQTGKNNAHKTDMITALESGDLMGYETMVEALIEGGVEESTIRRKISDTYKKKYQTAYRLGDDREMDRIADILEDSGFDFDLDDWEANVDEKYGW